MAGCKSVKILNNMRSPIKPHKQMVRVSLEEGLLAYECPESEGIFLPVASYVRWLAKQGDRLPHLVCSESELPLGDSTGVKICPESGQIMLRYKVGHDFSFYLDRSPTGSVWFDKGEWEAIRSRQFHDELHLIFTAPWQDSVQLEEQQRMEASVLKERLGDELVAKLTELKGVLDDHEYKSMALSYLQRKS